MGSVLVDDTRSCSIGTYGPALGRELARIAQYRLIRHSEYTWVRNIRFLVYDAEGDNEGEKSRAAKREDDDNTDDEEDLNDDEEEMLKRAIALSLQPDAANTGDTSEVDGSREAKPSLPNQVEQYGHTSKRQSQDSGSGPDIGSCKICSTFPSFPKHKKVTRFRVVRFPPEAFEAQLLCRHYVAISYCWKSNSGGMPCERNGSYRVRVMEEDGSVVERPNRAPDETIQRAVEFATIVGARLIWLDQECLPQDNSREQELGIQAMDMVYQRAEMSLGLLESVITSQQQLDSVVMMLDWAEQPGDPSQRRLRIAEQSEIFSVGSFIQHLLEYLELLAEDSWNQRAWILQESFSSASRMVIAFRTPAKSVYLGMPEVDTLIKATREFFTTGTMIQIGLANGGMTGIDHRGLPRATFGRACRILDSLDRLRPQFGETKNWRAYYLVQFGGGGEFGARTRCNAAVALSFLKTRQNHRPADRLAIVANLCDYEIRLDTMVLETSCTSLALCLFTLAFINGDLSLLVPEAYQLSCVKAPIQGPSWALPFPEIFHSIDVRNVRKGYDSILRTSNLYSVSEHGLCLPAYVWKVDQVVDLTSVQCKWKRFWDAMDTGTVNFNRRTNESVAEFHERMDIARQLTEVGEDIPDEMADPPTWNQFIGRLIHQDKAPAAWIRRHLFTDRHDWNSAAQWVICQLLFDILRYLHGAGKGSLANSIWHSIRADCFRPDPRALSDELPDDVSDLVSNDRLCAAGWDILQLDYIERGSFSQEWLINRVMKDGRIWTGKYTASHRYTAISEHNKPVEPSEQASGPSPNISTDWSLPSSKKWSKIRTQNAQQMLASALRCTLYENEAGGDLSPKGINLGSMSCWARLTSSLNWIKQPERLESTFDVDEACVVVTPYDYDMETLPRPSLRSRDICWVVQPVEGLARDHEDSPGKQQDPDDDQSHKTDKGKTRATDEEAGSVKMPFEGEVDGRFCILSRVKGMWEIMEYNAQSYEFV